jgi:hypothetical protein
VHGQVNSGYLMDQGLKLAKVTVIQAWRRKCVARQL